jgi:hypothetical protein
MSKNKSISTLKLAEVSRIQVKDGFDPLVQVLSAENSVEKKTISNNNEPLTNSEKNNMDEKLFGVNCFYNFQICLSIVKFYMFLISIHIYQ